MILFLFWFTLAILFFLIELGNPGLFFCLSFACGAITALMAALIAPTNGMAQGGSFFVGTVCAFFVLRCLVQKELHQHAHRTNVDALQGRRGIVITDITPFQPGSIKVDGQIWTAVVAHHESLYKNTPVEVVQVRGVCLVVVPVTILS